MRKRPTATGSATPPDPAGPVGGQGCSGAGRGLLACLAVSLVTTGCAGGKLTPIADATDFELRVLKSDMPVMVEFYKAGCPTCIILEPGLDQLADEYAGRVVLAKFKIWEWYFAVPSPEIKARYKIGWAPTVILFVDGEVAGRWVGHYNMADYRNALDAVAGPPLPESAIGVGPPADGP